MGWKQTKRRQEGENMHANGNRNRAEDGEGKKRQKGDKGEKEARD